MQKQHLKNIILFIVGLCGIAHVIFETASYYYRYQQGDNPSLTFFITVTAILIAVYIFWFRRIQKTSNSQLFMNWKPRRIKLFKKFRIITIVGSVLLLISIIDWLNGTENFIDIKIGYLIIIIMFLFDPADDLDDDPDIEIDDPKKNYPRI